MIARARAALAWVSTGAVDAVADRPAIAAIRPAGTTSRPPSTTGGSGEICALELQLLQPLLQPRLEVVGPLAGLARVEPGVGLPGLLLELELLGAVVPVGDLLGQPVLHRGFGLVDQLELARRAPPEVLRHDMGDGVALRLLLQLPRRSRHTRAARGSPQRRARRRPAAGSRGRARSADVRACPVGVESRRRASAWRRPALARAGEARVLDRVLKVEQHPRLGARVALVHQHRAALQQVAVALEGEVDDRVEQRMAGQTKAASGWPCGATSDFSKAIRS